MRQRLRMNEFEVHHPESARIEFAPEGDGVRVSTPCHGRRVFFSIGRAVAGGALDPVCRECGRSWLCDPVADDQAEAGLRPVWAEPPRAAEAGR